MRRISNYIDELKDCYYITKTGNVYRLKYNIPTYIEMISLRMKGHTYTEIVEMTNQSRTTVYRRIKNYPEEPYKKLNFTYSKCGYRRVGLYNKEDNQIDFRVGRLMGYCYLDLKRESDLVINHKNGVKDDDRLENLEVVTQSENMIHAIEELGYDPVKNLGKYAIGRKV